MLLKQAEQTIKKLLMASCESTSYLFYHWEGRALVISSAAPLFRCVGHAPGAS